MLFYNLLNNRRYMIPCHSLFNFTIASKVTKGIWVSLEIRLYTRLAIRTGYMQQPNALEQHNNSYKWSAGQLRLQIKLYNISKCNRYTTTDLLYMYAYNPPLPSFPLPNCLADLRFMETNKPNRNLLICRARDATFVYATQWVYRKLLLFSFGFFSLLLFATFCRILKKKCLFTVG